MKKLMILIMIVFAFTLIFSCAGTENTTEVEETGRYEGIEFAI